MRPPGWVSSVKVKRLGRAGVIPGGHHHLDGDDRPALGHRGAVAKQPGCVPAAPVHQYLLDQLGVGAARRRGEYFPSMTWHRSPTPGSSSAGTWAIACARSSRIRGQTVGSEDGSQRRAPASADVRHDAEGREVVGRDEGSGLMPGLAGHPAVEYLIQVRVGGDVLPDRRAVGRTGGPDAHAGRTGPYGRPMAGARSWAAATWRGMAGTSGASRV